MPRALRTTNRRTSGRRFRYWEMAASFVLRGAVDSDLYFDSNGEGLFIYAKFRHFADDYQKATGFPFMRQTATLLERFPAAKERFDRISAIIEARAAAATAKA